MLYIENITSPQDIAVPKVTETTFPPFVFSVRSTLLKGDEVEVETTLVDQSSQYFSLRIRLADFLPAGEYEYVLRGNREPVSTGIVIIGEWQRETITYDNDIAYEQYEQ